MRVDSNTEHDILATLDAFLEAYAKRDLSTIMALFVPDTDLVLIGTESDELLVGPDAIKDRFQSDWSRTDEMSMEIQWHSLSGTADICWVAAEIMVTIRAEGNKLQLPARISVVFEYREDQWLIAHWHASMGME